MPDFNVIQGKGSDFTAVPFVREADTCHSHPQDAGKRVFGRALMPGEVLQKGDMYGSSTGKWELVPEQLLGNEIRKGHGAILIRPGTPVTAR